MTYKASGRRDFLKHAGWMSSVAMMGGLPAFGGAGKPVIEDAVLPQQPEEPAKYHIKFSVCGMSHDHIYGMIGAVAARRRRTGRSLGRRSRTSWPHSPGAFPT